MEMLPIMPVQEMDVVSLQNVDTPSHLPAIVLRNSVLYPGVFSPISVNRVKSIQALKTAYEGDKVIAALIQKQAKIDDPKEQDIEKICTVAKIIKLITMPDNSITAIVHGLKRAELLSITDTEPFFKAEINVIQEQNFNTSKETKALIGNVRDITEKIVRESPSLPEETIVLIKNIEDPLFFTYFVASHFPFDFKDKLDLLKTNEPKKRTEKLLELLHKEYQFTDLKNQVANKTRTEIDKQQKEYFLQQQLQSIKEELGDGNDKEIQELKKQAENKKWPKSAQDLFDKNIEKLERMHPSTPDYSVVYNHTELLLDLPWDESVKEDYDIKQAKQILDHDHYGMEKAKQRILEYLAVLKIKGDMKSPILCFVGPPGVGKTSLGKSIATAMNRKYIRMSLGGLHDEAEIRGHRKTYIGAMPGRIIQAIKKVKSSQPVMVLDELDKLGNDFRGDPASALLEVLDPEQNNSFYDNYLEVEYDLSKVLFIATANDLQTIPAPLRDRLEIIELTGYATEEKVKIAEQHLVQKQKKAHGMEKHKFAIPEKLMTAMIHDYTRESGVRELDRLIASIFRHRALQYVLHEKLSTQLIEKELRNILGKPKYSNDKYKKTNPPGVVVGLAWTYVGGEILFVEALLAQGKGNLQLTGNLGKVMQESAQLAYSFLKSHASDYDIKNEQFEQNTLHIHVPEGATPKDGPSAGVTMLTSICSVLLNKKIKPYIAMTGEITLRGDVLPVGGIKEKILAAKRAGLKEIILSKINEKDVNEIESDFIKGLNFVYVNTMHEVLKYALGIH